MTSFDFTLAQLAEKVGAKVLGDESARISGLATIQSARSSEISFLSNPVYEKYLPQTNAGAVILAESMVEKCPVNVLVHPNPYLAYAQLTHLWDTSPMKAGNGEGIHPSAVIHQTATLAAGVSIGAGAVLEAGAVIGENAVIGANSFIGRDSVVGAGTVLHPSVVLYHGVSIGERCIIHSGVVIGSDGFGFAPDKGRWAKVAQLGGVVIGDDVEIGANTAIDRGALDNTVIENGVKLDNQIQIAHNVRVGENTAMAACCAVAGSTSIGKNCIIGGASGIAGHLVIADQVHITAMTMVIKSLTEPGVYSSGTGVQPNAKWRKSIARLRQLDQMAGRIKALEKKLKDSD